MNDPRISVGGLLILIAVVGLFGRAAATTPGRKLAYSLLTLAAGLSLIALATLYD